MELFKNLRNKIASRKTRYTPFHKEWTFQEDPNYGVLCGEYFDHEVVRKARSVEWHVAHEDCDAKLPDEIALARHIARELDVISAWFIQNDWAYNSLHRDSDIKYGEIVAGAHNQALALLKKLETNREIIEGFNKICDEFLDKTN